MRRRLDTELVRRGLADSRSTAAELIGAGRVRVSGTVAFKVARLVDAAEPVVVVGPAPRYVSRGGYKLAHGLDVFDIDPLGWRCLDAGASTGGFTDCLLQRGAREVLAVDVGHGQLHERLRADPRVDVRERVNVRYLSAADLGGTIDLVVADLSFISLRTVIPALLNCADGSDLIVLVKPQFEAGRSEVSRGKGVVRDPGVWSEVLQHVDATWRSHGAAMMGLVVSPVRGASGNVEFLAHVRVVTTAAPPAPESLVRAAIDAAVGLTADAGDGDS